ncbi:hypothetical protein M2322_000847 [Rhodoblastus acidophilus]|uniref:phage tail protein n=1 Tax=Rhodoblastus acidophilus TaxID=1074 RepID=UPI00222516DD|nr:phage tail protein [Rhodoblastus acidophilus]MCW2315313.1 hypothetical protein [Rhodoblastus acidophilus]
MTTTAYPTLQPGTSFQLKAGDGAATEVFTLLASATTKSFKQQIATDSSYEIDANAPTTLPVRMSVPVGFAADVSGSGKADFSRFHTLQGFLGMTKNYQIVLTGTGAAGGGTYQGAFILKELNLSTSDEKLITFDFALESAGALTFTAAS